jgi:hypothetical protein
MRTSPPSFALAPFVALIAAATALGAESATPLRFDRDIRPLLSENCYACHGPGQAEAGLRLDSAEKRCQPPNLGNAFDPMPGW